MLVDIRTDKVRPQPGLAHESGNPYEVTDSGHVEADPHRAAYPDVPLDRTDAGERLFVVKTSIFLSSASGEVRQVATGYPRLGPGLAGSFSDGTISESGHVITLKTTMGMTPRIGTAPSTSISSTCAQARRRGCPARMRPKAVGSPRAPMADSSSSTVPQLPVRPKEADGRRPVVLRWDRKSDKTVAVSLTDKGHPAAAG